MPTFDNNIGKIFRESFTAYFTSNEAFLKKVIDSISNNNDTRLQELIDIITLVGETYMSALAASA